METVLIPNNDYFPTLIHALRILLFVLGIILILSGLVKGNQIFKHFPRVADGSGGLNAIGNIASQIMKPFVIKPLFGLMLLLITQLPNVFVPGDLMLVGIGALLSTWIVVKRKVQ